MYEPWAVVYHHRRRLFIPHLRQIAGHGEKLLLAGVDKRRYAGTDCGQPLAGGTHDFHLPGDVEPALGGQLFAFFRHQADVFRYNFLGKGKHLFGHRHLEIQLGVDQLPCEPDVAVLDVAPVLAQVHRDRVGAGIFHQLRRVNRIGVTRSASLAQGSDVIDIDSQSDRGDGHV